jgi:hypothetical protein
MMQGDLRRNIALLLVARVVVRLVCAANGGGAVVVADHLDLYCGRPCWLLTRLHRRGCFNSANLPEKGLDRVTCHSPDGGGATWRGMLCLLRCVED